MAHDESELAHRSELLGLAEAAECLASPYAEDEYSAASGEPLLVVELTGEALPNAEVAPLVDALAGLACVTVAFVPDAAAPAAEGLAEAFDVLVETPDELAALDEHVGRSPLASTALAQLLRGTERRSLEQGLVAESVTYSMLQAGPEFAAWLAARPTLRPEVPERPPVQLSRDGARLDVLLDHPAKRNAYSAAMRDLLCEGLELAASDEAIEEVVLRGAGPAFCSGGDLDEFGLLADPATAHAIRTTRSAARWLARLAPRVRAELHGPCIGAGIELPAFAGTVLAAEDTTLHLPEVDMGLIPGAGGTVSLPRRIGRQRTAWLALTGTRLDRETAKAWNLVDGDL